MVLFFTAVIVYFVLDYMFDLPPAGLEFRSEVVKAVPNDEVITFEGEYVFVAHHPRKRSYELGFPIYEHSDQSLPKDIEVLVKGHPIEVRLLSQGMTYTLSVKPKQEVTVTMRYTLQAPEGKAVYITRTANLWPKPLKSALFVIPEGVQSNYHKAGETEAVFTDFRPKKNWEIFWRERP